jgi:hypothetical protein
MLVYIVTYEHKHGVDVSAYSTEEKAWAGVGKLRADYPEDFDEDDPQGWCDITTCEVDS